MIHFRELRSGRDLAYLMRRSIKYNAWSKGQSARHQVDRTTFENFIFTCDDYDLKIEMLLMMLALLMFLRALFSSSQK